MYRILTRVTLLIGLVAVTFWASSSARVVAQAGQTLTMASISTMAFGPDGMLFAADNQNAAIVALDLGAQAGAGAPGVKGLDGLDEKLAAMLGTAAAEITITDLAVHPRTRNAYVSAMRGQGAGAAPTLFRIDGTGKIDLVSMSALKLPARRAAQRSRRRWDGPAEPPRQRDYRHGVYRRQALGGGALERGVRVEASCDPVSVQKRGRGHQRRDLSRQSQAARNAIAGERVRALHDRQQAVPARRLYLHAAGEVPDRRPQAGREGARYHDRRVRCGQPRARHDRVPQGGPGVPPDHQQQPRRDEDPDRTRSRPPRRSPRRSRPKPVACRSRRSRQ